MGRETALRCADSAIRLVRKIDIYVKGSDKALSPWLRDRAPDTGRFPDEVFA